MFDHVSLFQPQLRSYLYTPSRLSLSSFTGHSTSAMTQPAAQIPWSDFTTCSVKSYFPATLLVNVSTPWGGFSGLPNDRLILNHLSPSSQRLRHHAYGVQGMLSAQSLLSPPAPHRITCLPVVVPSARYPIVALSCRWVIVAAYHHRCCPSWYAR